jgi:hypothetical protein
MLPRPVLLAALARQLVPVDSANYFDLEDPISLARSSQRGCCASRRNRWRRTMATA